MDKKIILLSLGIASFLNVSFVSGMEPDQDLKNRDFFNAIKRGDRPGALELLAMGANVNAMDEYGEMNALMSAVNTGSLEMVDTLIDAGADVNTESYDGHTALQMAVGRRDLKMIKRLLDAGADAKSQFIPPAAR